MRYNLFEKFKSWWYNLFHKPQKLNVPSFEKIDTPANKLEKANIFDEYREKIERNNYLLQLQKKFESKMITENEMADDDKRDLETLYMEQINNLKRNIKNVESKIAKLN